MAFLIMVSQSDYAAWSKAKANSKGEWTAVTESAVEGSQLPDSNPSDVAEFCAGYGNLRREDRVKFWVALMSKVAEFESDFKPHDRFTEPFLDGQGHPVISRGLLALSLGDQQDPAHGCKFRTPSELEEPDTNLRCGVSILSRLVVKDNLITDTSSGYKGGAKYWSVLRRKEKFAQISGFTGSQDWCKVAR